MLLHIYPGSEFSLIFSLIFPISRFCTHMPTHIFAHIVYLHIFNPIFTHIFAHIFAHISYFHSYFRSYFHSHSLSSYFHPYFCSYFCSYFHSHSLFSYFHSYFRPHLHVYLWQCNRPLYHSTFLRMIKLWFRWSYICDVQPILFYVQFDLTPFKYSYKANPYGGPPSGGPWGAQMAIWMKEGGGLDPRIPKIYETWDIKHNRPFLLNKSEILTSDALACLNSFKVSLTLYCPMLPTSVSLRSPKL